MRSMQSVYFPKLDEYAIEPRLEREPSGYGIILRTSSSQSSHSSSSKPPAVDDVETPPSNNKPAADLRHLVKNTAYFQRGQQQLLLPDDHHGTDQERLAVPEGPSPAEREPTSNAEALKRLYRQSRGDRAELGLPGDDYFNISPFSSTPVLPPIMSGHHRTSMVSCDSQTKQTSSGSLSREESLRKDSTGRTARTQRLDNKIRRKRIGSLRVSSWAQRINIHRLLTQKENFKKFQRLSVAVVNILKLAKAIIKPTDSPSALLKTFTAMSAQKAQEQRDDHTDKMKSYGLEFDASYFRANREISVSNEVKNILRQLPSRRTPEQVQTAIFGLQSLQSFAEYPLHMQEKLAKVAWFEIVTPMRTIIRQGHFAENFYFILSGQALVTIQKPGEPTPFTAGMMRKGTSFGELALLHHSRRTATVTSHDTVQLLSVGREDFFDIFMSGHGSDEMPEHIKFISQLDFMQDWPLERLLERPDQCLLHFFKRNMVILKDSELSEWFYVVKSGSCQVLKQLKGVTGRLGQLVSPRSSLRDTDSRFKSEPGFQARINTGRRQLRKKLTPMSHIDEVRSHKKADTSNSRLQSLREDKENDKTSPAERDGGAESNSPTGSLSYDARMDSKDSLSLSSGKHSSQRDRTVPRLSIGQPHFSPSLRQRDADAKDNKMRNVRSYSNRRSQRKEQQRQQEQQQQQQHHAEVPPVFVQIELLKPKDVFGLDMVNFNNTDFQPSNVSLVSLGAECIMLSKSFFLKYANDRVKKRFSEIVQPYPNERSLQASLQNKADWELYKKSVIAAVTAPKSTGFRGAPLTFSM